MKNKKTECLLKTVWLMRDGEEISYGDMTTVIEGLPKSRVIGQDENGKDIREPIHYEKSFYEQWQHNYSQHIVSRLNRRLPKAKKRNRTLYYFLKEELIMVEL